MIDNKIYGNSNNTNIKTAIKYGVDNHDVVSGTEWSTFFNRPNELNNIDNPDSLIIFVKLYISLSGYSYMVWCQLDYKTYKNQTYWLDIHNGGGFLLKLDKNYNILAKYTNWDGSSAGNFSLDGNIMHRTNACLAFYYFL